MGTQYISTGIIQIAVRNPQLLWSYTDGDAIHGHAGDVSSVEEQSEIVTPVATGAGAATGT